MIRSLSKIVLILFAFSHLPQLFGGTWQWITFTDASDIRQFVVADSTLWCATNGGVVRLNVSTGEFKKYTNTDGLTSNDVVAIEYDPRGFVWAALANGGLNLYNLHDHVWDFYRDPSAQIQTIHTIVASGDSVFVGSNVGISMMKLDDNKRWEIPWTAKIGEVKQIVVTDRQIWTGLDQEIKSISKKHPNPQAPGSWSTFNILTGLPGDEVISLYYLDKKVFVGTSTGLSGYNGEVWGPIELPDYEIRNFTRWGDQLVAVTDEGIFKRQADERWVRVGPWLSKAYHAAVFADESLWISVRDEGLATLDRLNNVWISSVPDGPGSNKFSALALDRDGVLWAASSDRGVFRFDGRNWRIFDRESGLPSNDYRDVIVDKDNRAWAASWGGGIAIFEAIEPDSIAVRIVGVGDNRLAGVSSNSNYVVVTKLALDASGNVWILNYQAADHRPLAVTDPFDNWQYFSTLDGIPSDLVTALAIDNNKRKWVGTEFDGVRVVDDGNTPFDKSDDDLTQGLNANDGLESQSIRSLAIDMDGVTWIGTPKGLNFWFNGDVGVRYNVINDNINTIAVDVRNNKWIGTSGGLSMLDADGYSWTHYTTSNSRLVADNVTCFAFNEKTGGTYIGTTNGLSLLETPYTRPEENLDLVTGYPNPFLIDSENSRFFIDNLAENCTVRIYTPEGYFVRHIPESDILGSRASWDGRNDRGKLVASGVYLYLVTSSDGLAKTGKVAVIKR